MNKLLSKAKSLPGKPGCYLMKREDGQIIYVGKAKNLAKRVSSYFLESKKDLKTESLRNHIHDFDFILTENETEALILENNLIKKHGPKYNIRLKDDKSYPYVVIDYASPFPRLSYQRNVLRKKKQAVFGPFVLCSNVLEIVRIIIKALKLRDCNDFEFKSRKRPCLLHQMNHCYAPCCGLISKEEYASMVEMAEDFFRGNSKKIENYLTVIMEDFSHREEYEQAAVYRDYLQKIKMFNRQNVEQNVELYGKHKNLDIISHVIGEKETDIVINMVRNHLLIASKGFHFANNFLMDDSGLLGLLYQHYEKFVGPPPDRIVLCFDHEDEEIFIDALRKLLNKNDIEIQKPTARFLPLVQMATDQARENQKLRAISIGSEYKGLLQLSELLKLKSVPRVLECFDIAIWQGDSPAASQVVFHDGRSDKSRYRFYKLKERPEGNNDFAMMSELLERRLAHGNYPDVFVVDGGKGQVNSFLHILQERNIQVPVIGIAKKNNAKSKDERLIIPGRMNEYPLSRSRDLMKILVSMRDEAHRFSRRLHHKNENQRIMESWLDDIDGVGAVLKKTILKNLDKPIEELRNYSESELMDYLKVNQTVARNILKKLI